MIRRLTGGLFLVVFIMLTGDALKAAAVSNRPPEFALFEEIPAIQPIEIPEKESVSVGEDVHGD